MAKISGVEIKPGTVVEIGGELWAAVKSVSVKPGKGPAYNQVELKNVRDGRKLNHRFGTDDRVDVADLEYRDFQYLYKEGGNLVFMDSESYEQITLAADFVGERAAFLQDNMQVTLRLHGEAPIGIRLPDTAVLLVTEADPHLRGQTAASSYKSALLENGLKIQVPAFIEAGVRVVVDTNEVAYVKRAE